jgi:hypothetical protein
LELPNLLLVAGDGYWQIQAVARDAAAESGGPLRLKRVRRWTSPGQFLHPVAEAIADLVCHADFRLIRKCETAACRSSWTRPSPTTGGCAVWRCV